MEETRRIREALADLLTQSMAHAERDVIGYVVLVLDKDHDPPKPVMTFGLAETPEQALIAAGRMDTDPDGGTNPIGGEPGWDHIVLPVFPIEEVR